MNKSRTRSLSLFLLWLIILSHQIRPVVCEREQYNGGKPSFFQVASSTIALLKKSHKSSWEKIKTIIHEFQLQFSRPDLDFRVTGTGKAGTSEVTVEETAKSAAEAVRKAAEKAKGSASDFDKEESHDEL